MDTQPPDNLTSPVDETPETLLEAFRTHPEWTERQRDEQLDRLIERVPVDRLVAAVRRRMHDLSGFEGEAVLRIIEAYPSPELLRELGEALVAQPELSPERSWEALTMLEGADLLTEFPELLARADELDELLDEEGSLEELAEQLEGDPEGTWLALQGLGAVEPEIRPHIIEGLGQGQVGPGLAEFLRLLSFAHDPPTRAAALEVLSRPVADETHVAAAWKSIAADHPDAEVVTRARDWLAGRSKADVPAVAATSIRPASSVIRSLVTALDGRGRGSVVLASFRGDEVAAALFLCDVTHGVCDVIGQVDFDSADQAGLFEQLIEETDLEFVEDVPELALRLLGGSVLLCGRSTPPTLRYWLEATVPPGFRALPFPSPYPGWDPSVLPFDEMPDRARAVLGACPSWLDDSTLTYEMAEEIALREAGEALPDPDPRRDAGAYRYLFEHRLLGQLELYRRMLYWMASFWQAAGREYLGHSALALAWQLSDAQHSVPSHPFTVELTTRSLKTAQANLRRGIDPRRTPRLPNE